MLLIRNLATFVSELFDISKMQQIYATVMLPNRYRQLITSQLQPTSQIVMRKFLIRRNDMKFALCINESSHPAASACLASPAFCPESRYGSRSCDASYPYRHCNNPERPRRRVCPGKLLIHELVFLLRLDSPFRLVHIPSQLTLWHCPSIGRYF